MRQVKLLWYSPFPVKVLRRDLEPDNHYRNLDYPELNNYGFYMYIDEDTNQVRYVGQTFMDSPQALRIRARQEIVKDNEDGAKSAFYLQCKKYDVDKFHLLFKVAHIQDAKEDGVDAVVDIKFMNAVERALIFERARAGDPLINERGKRRYLRGPIRIENSGNYRPLPDRIDLG